MAFKRKNKDYKKEKLLVNNIAKVINYNRKMSYKCITISMIIIYNSKLHRLIIMMGVFREY